MTTVGQTILSRSTAPHYTWAEVCDGWHLANSAGLSVIEERMPPGAEEVRHLHRKAYQLFYVLEGKLTLEVDDEIHGLRKNDALSILPHNAHQARNETQEDVRFLVISSPSTAGDREQA